MTKSKSFPSNVDAERAILGAIMDPHNADEVLDRVQVSGLLPKHFYRPDHAALYSFLRDRFADGKPLDPVSITTGVARAQVAERCGGLEYISEIPDHCVSTINVEHYCGEVMADAARRETIEQLQASLESLLEAQEEPGQVRDRLIGQLTSSGATGDEGWVPMWQAVDESVEQTVCVARDPKRHGGLSTGYPELDKSIANLHPGDVLVIAGRPAQGKSSIAMNIAENVATSRGPDNEVRNVGIFTLEMSRHQLAARSIAADAGVSARDMRRGVQKWELQPIEEARQRVRVTLQSIHINDCAELSISQIRAHTRRLKTMLEAKGEALHLVIVDYLQLIGSELGRGARREEEVSHISRGLKIMAKNMGVPVISVCQLNRQCEQRADKRPIMSDLRESGAIEQDADSVVFVFRPEYYWPEDPKNRGLAEIIVGKARHGETGSVYLAFNARLTRFSRPKLENKQTWGMT